MRENWEGIPGQWVIDATAIDGRRFVASREGVRRLRARMRHEADAKCEYCGHACYLGDRHHIYGRGMGGSKTEDRPEVMGIRFVVWICRTCHDIVAILPWGSWRQQVAEANSSIGGCA